MRASKKTTAVLSSFILSILPFLILWAAWSVLPDTIPAHWSGVWLIDGVISLNCWLFRCFL